MRSGTVRVRYSDGSPDTLAVTDIAAAKKIDPGMTVVKEPSLVQQAIKAYRPFAAAAIPAFGQAGSPSNRFMGQFLTDPQTAAWAASAPLGDAPMLIRTGISAAAAGGQAAAQGQGPAGVAGNAILAGLPEPVAEYVAKPAMRATSEMMMKTSLGRAAVGSVQKALKYGLAPTEKFLDFVNSKIGALKTKAIEGANALEAAGHTASLADLEQPLISSRARYGRYDVTGDKTRDALNEVIQTMDARLGTPVGRPTVANVVPEPKLSTADRMAAAQKQMGRAKSGDLETGASGVRQLTPTELQTINEIAGDKLKEWFAARQNGLGASVDPGMELATRKVWARSKQLLEGMGGDVGKQVGAANKEMQNLYRMDILARKAGERAHGLTGFEKGASAAATIGGLTGGAMAHNPGAAAAGLASIPLMLAMHGATSPEGMAAMARALYSPAAGAVASGVPRLGAVGLGQLFNR